MFTQTRPSENVRPGGPASGPGRNNLSAEFIAVSTPVTARSRVCPRPCPRAAVASRRLASGLCCVFLRPVWMSVAAVVLAVAEASARRRRTGLDFALAGARSEARGSRIEKREDLKV